MHHFRSLIILLLLVGFCRPCSADDDARNETRTYGVWINDIRVGSATVTLAPIEVDGKPAFKVTADAQMRLKTDVGLSHRRMEHTTVSLADGTGVRSMERNTTNGNVRIQRVTYGPEAATRDEEFMGRSTRIQVPTKGPIIDDDTILVRHLARTKKLKTGETFDYTDVSFERKRTYRKTLHVDERIAKEDGSVRWRMHTTSELEDDAEEERIIVDAEGNMVEMSQGPLLVRAIDASELEFDTSEQSPFGATVATKPSIAGHHLERLQSLVVRVRLPGGKAAFRTNGYQEVLEQDDRTFRIRLVPNPRPDDSKVEIPVDAERLSVFLRETEEAESAAPKIVEHSAQVVGDAKLAHEVAGRISSWIFETLEQVINGQGLTALETLKVGEGDCSEHTCLYLALARAAKLPSRSLTGLLLTEEGFGLHAWAESWMGRWVPVDPAWDRVGTGPVYLSLGPDLDDDGIARSSGLRAAATFGNISIDILELDLDGQRFDATDVKEIWTFPEDPKVIVERIVLRSGLAFHGAEVERDPEHIVYRTPYGRARVARADLDRIEFHRGRSNHFESAEHGVCFDLPTGWTFVDESQWPNAQTVSTFKKGDVGYGLLLSEPFSGNIDSYFALLRRTFNTTKGTDAEPTPQKLASAAGEVDALRWGFVDAKNNFHYRLLTWKRGARCYRIVAWTTASAIGELGPSIDAILKSVQLR